MPSCAIVMRTCTKVPAKNRSFFYFYLAIIEAAMMRFSRFERDGGAATVRLCAVTHC
jgi:hypothetical protein